MQASLPDTTATPIAADDTQKQAKDKQTRPPKNFGENLFVAVDYGGLAWIANEIISGIIGSWIKKPEETSKAGFLHDRFQGGIDSLHHSVKPVAEKTPLIKSRYTRNWIERPATIFVYTIGGNLLVPAEKWLEDRKEGFVRAANRLWYGKDADCDPKLQESYKAMAAEPKQSWFSMWGARVAVITSAITLDYFSGNENSPSTKALQGTFMEPYANMERMGRSITRDILSWVHPNKEKREAIAHARKHTPLEKVNERVEGKAAKTGEFWTFLLVLSGALTVMFYGLSRVLAVFHETKKEEKQALREVVKERIEARKSRGAGPAGAREESEEADQSPPTPASSPAPTPMDSPRMAKELAAGNEKASSPQPGMTIAGAQHDERLAREPLTQSHAMGAA